MSERESVFHFIGRHMASQLVVSDKESAHRKADDLLVALVDHLTIDLHNPERAEILSILSTYKKVTG